MGPGYYVGQTENYRITGRTEPQILVPTYKCSWLLGQTGYRVDLLLGLTSTL